nr:MAG TPA: hypothetical protein [Caudoviricetes sp.]
MSQVNEYNDRYPLIAFPESLEENLAYLVFSNK